jgi:hypothetical protein
MKKTFKDVWETAANAAGSGEVSMPADVQMDKEKKKKEKKQRLYDGRTREGREMFRRILARREARLNAE